MLFKIQTAWTGYNIFYLFKTGKKPKPFLITVLIPTHTAEECPCEARALSGCDKPRSGRREGRVPTGSPRTPGRAAPSRQGVTLTHLLFTARHPGLRPPQGRLLLHTEFMCHLLCGKQTCQDQYFFTSTSFCTLDSACLVFRVNPHNSKWNQLEWCILSFIFYLSVYLSPLLYSKTPNSVLVN